MKNKTLFIVGAAALGFMYMNKDKDEPIDVVDDLCEDVVCLNGGKCRSGVCQCTPNFEGKKCEIPRTRQ